MVQISDQSELQTALRNREEIIQVTASFNIVSQITINYAVSLSSPDSGTIHVLTKDSTYAGFLFRVTGGSSLTLANLTLDGGRDNSPAPGGGIYNDGTLFTYGYLDITNGVYITNRESVVRLQGPLEPGSAIQINN